MFRALGRVSGDRNGNIIPTGNDRGHGSTVVKSSQSRSIALTRNDRGHEDAFVNSSASEETHESQEKESVNNPDTRRRPKTSVDVKKPPPPKYPAADFENCTVLEPGDSIYAYGDWDGAPVVVPEHKLLFFTVPKVGCTVWKQLFRRIAGYDDWLVDGHPLPHAPARNGLAYLYDYPPKAADRMLTDPAWTRAIFVREPKERLLSAYLDKGRQNSYLQFHCCPRRREEGGALYEKLQCANKQPHKGPMASQQDAAPPLVSFDEFLASVVPNCRDKHWEPQHLRLDSKYWKYINFVGHMESMEADARRLLQRVGLWDEYGRSGWPPTNQAIFQGAAAVRHATDSSSRLQSFFSPQAEELVDRIVQPDYENPVLGLTRKTIAIQKQR
jgi:hypothetical protein